MSAAVRKRDLRPSNRDLLPMPVRNVSDSASLSRDLGVALDFWKSCSATIFSVPMPVVLDVDRTSRRSRDFALQLIMAIDDFEIARFPSRSTTGFWSRTRDCAGSRSLDNCG